MKLDYETWYNDWMKRLAKTKTRQEVVKELERMEGVTERAAESHLKAVEASTSMSSQSARRAHTRNTVSTAGDYKIALDGALEIHDKFPEYAKD